MTPTPSDDAPQGVQPLGPGWITATAAIGIMAALIALGGMILSYHAVSTEMISTFSTRWAWLVPIVVDLTVLVFSGVDLVLNRLDMSHPLARWTVYGATTGTIWLNYSAGGNPAGRTAHILMPAIWVVFIELMRHVVRRHTGLANGTYREPIPTARWFLSPWPTLKLWRRMVLWRINSYPAALAQERVRLARVARARAEHGPLWRWRITALERLSIALAEQSTPPGSEQSSRAEQSTLALPERAERQSRVPALHPPEHATLPTPPGGALPEHNPHSANPTVLEAEHSEPTTLAVPPVRTAATLPEQRNQSRVPEQQPEQSGTEQQSTHSGVTGAEHSGLQSDDTLECLTTEETHALNRLVAECAPRIPSQGAIRSALPPAPDGTRCGASRAIRIQRALRARAEQPDDPDPLADAIDTELAATTPGPRP